MEAGDLIRWRDQVWLVRKVDRELATAVVEAWDRNTEVLASDADRTGECEVWCKPSQQWPSAALPFKAGASRLVGVQLAGTHLIRLLDWVKLDDFQIGGALYLNPNLNLGYGYRLTAVFTGPRGNSVTLPVEIPRNFSPLPDKRSLILASVPAIEPSPPAKPSPALFARLKRDE